MEQWSRSRCNPCYHKARYRGVFDANPGSGKVAKAENEVGAVSPQKDGYVLEWDGSAWIHQHRLRMQEKLGRALVKGENVHHINGVRDDNRVDNLELWATVQPYGQRVSQLLDYVIDFHREEIMRRLGL